MSAFDITRSLVGFPRGSDRSGRCPPGQPDAVRSLKPWCIGLIAAITISACGMTPAASSDLPPHADAFVFAMREWSLSQDYWTRIDELSDGEIAGLGTEACRLFDIGRVRHQVVGVIASRLGEAAATTGEAEAMIDFASSYFCDEYAEIADEPIPMEV